MRYKLLILSPHNALVGHLFLCKNQNTHDFASPVSFSAVCVLFYVGNNCCMVEIDLIINYYKLVCSTILGPRFLAISFCVLWLLTKGGN